MASTSALLCSAPPLLIDPSSIDSSPVDSFFTPSLQSALLSFLSSASSSSSSSFNSHLTLFDFRVTATSASSPSSSSSSFFLITSLVRSSFLVSSVPSAVDCSSLSSASVSR
uniref:Putative secreted peptide n=1 Tax=Anopheles braziliensis TaxID=58242 RepID=A0A2M3ZQC4_9DIPT